MKRLLKGALLFVLTLTVGACGAPRKSVFPPSLSIQELNVLPNGEWRLTLRIQNNSYGEMDFNSLEGRLQIAQLIPIRLHSEFQRDIPQLTGDVVQIDALPTQPMTQALRRIADKGSGSSLAYHLSGSTNAKPEQEKQPRDFDFGGDGWLSPAPGIPNTFR